MGKIAEVQEVPVAELVPYERNAKIHSAEQVEKIKKSIQEFGFLSPCLIDRQKNIIAGHGRVMAAKELGMQTVPCVYIEGLTDTQRKAYILADNKLTELGEWNMDTVQAELEALTEDGFDASLTGFDWDAVSKLDDITEDDYDTEHAEELQPRTKRGDIYQLGEHRLMCGDSTSPEDMNALFGNERAAMVFTDPPYGVAIGSKNAVLNTLNGTHGIDTDILNDTADSDELYNILMAAFSLLREHAEDYCSYYVTSPLNGSLGLMMQMMMRDAGLPVRHILIWVKNVATFSVGWLDYDYRHEPIFYTWTKSHKFRGGYDNTVIDETEGRLDQLEKSELKELVHALRHDGSTTTIYCDKPQQNKLHPTMKPVRLVSRFIYNSSEEGDIIADIFGGSGTTLIAAEQLKRRCLMMELDPHYCDVIIDRWEQYTGKKAVKING